MQGSPILYLTSSRFSTQGNSLSILNWAENDINDHVSLVDTNRALRRFSAQSNDRGLLVDSDAYIETVS